MVRNGAMNWVMVTKAPYTVRGVPCLEKEKT